MLKISHQVIAKFATAGNGNKNAGASAVVFQTVPSPPVTASQVRPALPEMRIQRPAAAAANCSFE